MRGFLLALPALLVLGSAQALAGDHPLTIKNESPVDLTRIVVHHGTVAGFKRLSAHRNEAVTVSLPDGTCKVDVVATFTDGDYNTKFDFCQWDTLTVW